MYHVSIHRFLPKWGLGPPQVPSSPRYLMSHQIWAFSRKHMWCKRFLVMDLNDLNWSCWQYLEYTILQWDVICVDWGPFSWISNCISSYNEHSTVASAATGTSALLSLSAIRFIASISPERLWALFYSRSLASLKRSYCTYPHIIYLVASILLDSSCKISKRSTYCKFFFERSAISAETNI